MPLPVHRLPARPRRARGSASLLLRSPPLVSNCPWRRMQIWLPKISRVSSNWQTDCRQPSSFNWPNICLPKPAKKFLAKKRCSARPLSQEIGYGLRKIGLGQTSSRRRRNRPVPVFRPYSNETSSRFRIGQPRWRRPNPLHDHEPRGQRPLRRDARRGRFFLRRASRPKQY